jgi:hypothetical protein
LIHHHCGEAERLDQAEADALFMKGALMMPLRRA